MEKQHVISINEFAKHWPSPFVARPDIEKFSGGLLNPKTMANLDCQGKGPKRLRVGRKTIYRVADVVSWLNSRIEKS